MRPGRAALPAALVAGLALVAGSAAPAQPLSAGSAPPAQPLSSIDWLSDSLAAPAALQPEGRPARPGTEAALAPEVTVAPLDAPATDGVGLTEPAAAGLPAGLWGPTTTDAVARRLAGLPDQPLPAARDALMRLLLAQLDPPREGGTPGALALARVDTLLRWGALDEAAALIEAAGTDRPELFRRAFDIALLQERENAACARLRRAPGIAPSIPVRIFCLARSGDWAAAALTLDSAEALGELAPAEEALLARFLELDDGSGLLPPSPPRPEVTPLAWRMLEAIGERRPTAGLPLAFAHADLRPTAGWKARLEATERLVRAGALPPGRIAEVYAERAPAASGGVWDRVAAIRALERALAGEDAEEIARRLDSAWEAMRAAGLGPAFAALYAPRLSALELPGPAGRLAHRLALLGPGYEAAALDAPADADPLAVALARGLAPAAPPRRPLPAALAAAFTPPAPPAPAPLARLKREGRLGEALLAALGTVSGGARADPADLTGALVFLRDAGLEETARRAALQIYLLGAGA